MAGNYSPKIVDDGLLLYLDAANERSYPSSGTRWSDLSGNNHNGIILGANYFNDYLGGFSFDGINDGINIGTSDRLMLTASITLSAVFSQSSYSGSLKTIIGRWGGPPNYNHNYYFYVQSGTNKLAFSFKSSSGSYLTTSLNFIPDLNKIYHVCVTYDTINSKNFYINGELFTDYSSDAISTQSMMLSPGSSVSISSSIIESSFYSNNKIYSIKIYNRKLTSIEVKQNFLSVKTRYNL